jgi:uncharacterized protein (TIGR03086 family)
LFAVDTKHGNESGQLLSQAFASTRVVLAGVRPDQLDLPTPCASWPVRDLISHFIGTARWAAAAIAGSDESTEADYAAGDFLASYDDSARTALAAFGANGALDRTVKVEFGDLSGVALAGLAAGDQFVHGWDLARAIGYPADLNPELAEVLLGLAKMSVPDENRGPDGLAPFGPIAPAPADAIPADRLAAFLGRSV